MARSIEFKDWFYWDWEVGMKDFEFKGVMIKHIVFTNCGFANTKLIKKVIIDSGLAKMLDKVTFKGFRKGKGDVEKMKKEYIHATRRRNLQIIVILDF